ncbi:hypothetical protein [Alkalibacillus silvisoli]|uniref:RNA polymerase subunit sigma n=1 Tax=Alkalibacillus silvisoli TaxID=392823 RepID=A0ABN0ZWL9_9BACI
MSWKAVEMQVALPRTQDAGQLQDQLQQRGQIMQDNIAQQQLRELERKRKSVLESEHAESVHNEGDEQHEESDSYSDEEHQRSEQKNGEKYRIPHPYLGNRVDFSR